jgi:hypothetical protein
LRRKDEKEQPKTKLKTTSAREAPTNQRLNRTGTAINHPNPQPLTFASKIQQQTQASFCVPNPKQTENQQDRTPARTNTKTEPRRRHPLPKPP